MITSLQNNLVKQIVGLREAKNRKTQGLFIIDGMREIVRAKEAGIIIDNIIVCPSLLSHASIFKSPTEVDKKVFEKIAFGDRLEGILAIAQLPKHHLGDIKLKINPLIIILESLEKPGNLGAVLRSSDGAGVDAVIVGDAKVDIYNPNVIRASTGMVFSLPVIGANNEEILAWLNQHKINPVATFIDAKQSYTQYDWRQPSALILGTEDKGLSPFWQKNAKEKISIPMKGKADSLNVSVSAAIIAYEALRQRDH